MCPAEKTARYIPTDAVNAFALLFRGNPKIHYVRSEHGKYHQVDKPATTEDYLRHLRGLFPSLLISPIMPGGRCFFVGGDVDRHDPDNDTPVDVVALAKQIEALGLPLIVTRSKNGRGAWLWLFFKEPEGFNAAKGVQLMETYLDVLGLRTDANGKDTEIFPAQTDIAEGKSGNGVNLAMFGDEREAYGPDGERLDLTGFLKLANERAVWGCHVAMRDLDVTLLGHEVKGGILDATNKLNEEVALPGGVLRSLYQQALDRLSKAVRGNWRLTVNATTFVAGRVFASHALDVSEADIQNEIRKVARASQPSPENHSEFELDKLIETGWADGAARPYKILDLQEEHDIALQQIDALLHDEEMEVTQFKAVMYSAAKLDALEYDALRQRIARRLKMSAEDFDKHVDECKPKEEAEKDDLAGQAVIFEAIELWPEEVNGAQLLTDMSGIFEKYIHFPKRTDPDAVCTWTLGTHAFKSFDVFPKLGMTSRDENSGKSTVLKCLLRLVRSPFPGVAPTAAVLFRVIEGYDCPTLIIDEGDNSFYSKEMLDVLAILNSGQEKDLAFVSRNVPVGDGYQVRNFSTWAPMAYAMIGKPDRTLLSRSIEIRMLRAKAHEVPEKLPRLRFTPPIFEELRRKCARWAADNITKLSEVEIESTLINRAGDNWEPLLQMATLVGGVWPERIVTASTNYGDETNVKSDMHILLRDIRDIFKDWKVTRVPVAALVGCLNAKTESPWGSYGRLEKGLTANLLGRMLGGDGIVSKPIHLTEGEQTVFEGKGWPTADSTRVYVKADFEDLFERFLADDPEDRKPEPNPPF